jgi:hypothetical protein
MKYRLTRPDLLDYALEGLITYRGVNSGRLDDDELDELEAHEKQIRQRIALIKEGHERNARAEEALTALQHGRAP